MFSSPKKILIRHWFHTLVFKTQIHRQLLLNYHVFVYYSNFMMFGNQSVFFLFLENWWITIKRTIFGYLPLKRSSCLITILSTKLLKTRVFPLQVLSVFNNSYPFINYFHCRTMSPMIATFKLAAIQILSYRFRSTSKNKPNRSTCPL